MDQQSNTKPKFVYDLIIKIGDRKFYTNRDTVTKKLRFFARRITEIMYEEKQSVLIFEKENIDPEVFQDILDYIHTSDIEINPSNIESIYKTADYLNFSKLLDEAEESLKGWDVPRADLLIIRLKLAVQYNLTSILSESIQALKSQVLFDVFVLSYEDLKMLLKFMNEKKEKMFHTCVKWIDHDLENRSCKLLELLKLIPIDQLSMKFLTETVFKNNLVKADIECWNLVSQVFRTLETEVSVTFGYTPSECLYAIGGLDNIVLSSVSKLDSLANNWASATPLPNPRTKFDCAVFGRKIYICGGSIGKLFYDKVLNDLIVYDTDIQQWSQLQPMKHPRRGCAMAELDGFLYVAGGTSPYDNDRGVSVVERYSVVDDHWETVASMTFGRHTLELVSMNGFLYAIGGYIECWETPFVERYNPQTNEWKEVASLSTDYVKFGAAVLNNRIYVSDGDSCEVYNPDGDQWETLPVPAECYWGTRLAVFNGKLLAIGGRDHQEHDFSDRSTIRVERLDFEANAWVAEADMDVARCDHRVAVVNLTSIDSIQK